MGMMTRIMRLWKADLHGVMDQLEDKALLLKQCLREMETSLQQKHRRLNRIRRSCEQIRTEHTAREIEQQKLEDDLSLAVNKNKDDIARLLIRKRLVIQKEGECLNRRLRQLEEEYSRLAEQVQQQQSQYEQLKIKCAAYCQQAEQQIGEENSDIWAETPATSYPSEEEIELELLRLKDAMPQGGAQ